MQQDSFSVVPKMNGLCFPGEIHSHSLPLEGGGPGWG